MNYWIKKGKERKRKKKLKIIDHMIEQNRREIFALSCSQFLGEAEWKAGSECQLLDKEWMKEHNFRKMPYSNHLWKVSDLCFKQIEHHYRCRTKTSKFLNNSDRQLVLV